MLSSETGRNAILSTTQLSLPHSPPPLDQVKSARAGKMNIRDGFARVEENGRLRLLNCHIAKHFTTGAFFNHEEVRRPQVWHTMVED